MLNQRARLAMLSLVVTSLFAGCAQIEDCKDEKMTCLNNMCEAHVAWKCAEDCFANDPYRHDFGKGFRQGYIDAMNGKGECAPTLPPRCYWKTHNRTCDYPQKVASWYDGYLTGTTQAAADGLENNGRIITSLELYGQTKCQAEFEWPVEGAQPLNHDLELSPPPLPGTNPPSLPELPPADHLE